jgi:hypothetical protein
MITAEKQTELARLANLTKEDVLSAERKEARQKALMQMMTPDEIKACQMFDNDPLDYLKERGDLNMNALLTGDDIETCNVLGINPLDYYLARKFKC